MTRTANTGHGRFPIANHIFSKKKKLFFCESKPRTAFFESPSHQGVCAPTTGNHNRGQNQNHQGITVAPFKELPPTWQNVDLYPLPGTRREQNTTRGESQGLD